jgi:hypothetical protein
MNIQITPVSIANIGWKTYVIFTILNACGIPTVYFFFPETLGMSLEDVDHIFEAGGITGGVLKKRYSSSSRGSASPDPEQGNEEDDGGEKSGVLTTETVNKK